MKTFKTAYDAHWLLLFLHNISVDGFMTKEEAICSDSPGKYSILNQFNSLTKYYRYYEFLMEYPNLDYIRWTQTANPIKTTERTTNPKDLGVVYKHCTYANFRGLARSSVGSSYLDGDGVTVGEYWYSIGTISWNHDLIPGPNRTSVSQVSLWMRLLPQYTCFSRYIIQPFFLFVSIFSSTCNET